MIKDIEEELKIKFGASKHINVEYELSMSCRNWGTWELPEDMEDEEDYDFEELTSASYQKMTSIIKELNKKYKEYKISSSVSEKNYIDFRVEKI